MRWRDLAEGWKAPSASGAARGLVDNRFYKPHRLRPRTPARHAVASGPAPQSARRVTPPLFPSPLLLPFRTSAAFERVRAGLLPWAPLALVAFCLDAQAQPAEDGGIQLRPSPALTPAPRGDAAKTLPIILRARELRGRPDLEAIAEGDAELRRGGVVIHADRLSYEQVEDLARAIGNVRISQNGNVFSGPELQLKLQAFEGYFQNPTYRLGRIGTGGQADRIDFLDDQRAVATNATYTSCSLDGSGAPAWVLSAGSVRIDQEANEGVASNGVLRFYGVPILAAPSISFPLSEARKSGWLPPSIALDSKSGFQVGVPYYWNIAPNRDATLTPTVSASPRRRTRHRGPLSRAALQRRIDAQPAAVRPVGAALSPCAAGLSRQHVRPRHAAPAPPAARLRRRLLEGLPARHHEPDAAPARNRPALQPAVR